MVNEIWVRTAGGMMLTGENWGTRRKPIPLPISLRQIPNWMAWNQIRTSAVSVLRLESKMEEETEGWWTELRHGKVCVEEKIWNCDRRRDGRTHKVIPCSKVLPEKLIIPQTNKLSQVIKPTGSLSHPQQPATVPIPRQINSVHAPLPTSLFRAGPI